MFIKCVKSGVNVEVQNANAIPPDTEDYNYSEIDEAEYNVILAEFAARESGA